MTGGVEERVDQATGTWLLGSMAMALSRISTPSFRTHSGSQGRDEEGMRGESNFRAGSEPHIKKFRRPFRRSNRLEVEVLL
ncbi:hypothetical protein FEM03_10450 [Phragmitibacter flavus]|uniref:Uncharacterized protein n=1 Tax=Phragmitibacter flavus TaxID=2576071 RepID=A0A5R8KEJ7_9BACT|nr:hypothetical protein [Phragmitibacter flavus]TLD70723.1 hypothetical protein FEM03_10450 [Phragmitibacter flavus]